MTPWILIKSDILTGLLTLHSWEKVDFTLLMSGAAFDFLGRKGASLILGKSGISGPPSALADTTLLGRRRDTSLLSLMCLY